MEKRLPLQFLIHIAYTPSYRGINWDYFDSSISPVVEVYSKHGCSINEDAAYPYYHDMGPRDTRNMVDEGLRRGYHFSFVAIYRSSCWFSRIL